ncbi:unnamed protein product, partial [Porites evermanni]
RSSGSDSKRRKTATKSKLWTAHFACFADWFCFKTPTSVEKQILFKAVLGLKRIKPDLEDDENTVKEKITSDALDKKCNKSKKEILVRELRKHLWDCEDADDEIDDSTLHASVFETRPTTLGSSTTTTAVLSHVVLESTQRNLTTSAVDSLVSHSPSVVERSSTAMNPDPANPPSLNSSGEDSSIDTPLTMAKMSVDEVVNKTVHIARHNVNNPVDILRCFQQNIVTGIDLEVEKAHKPTEGETNYIMVDRSNLLQSSFDELSCLQDYRKTLEVQFYD